MGTNLFTPPTLDCGDSKEKSSRDPFHLDYDEY